MVEINESELQRIAELAEMQAKEFYEHWMIEEFKEAIHQKNIEVKQ